MKNQFNNTPIYFIEKFAVRNVAVGTALCVIMSNDNATSQWRIQGGVRGVQMHPTLAASNVFLCT